MIKKIILIVALVFAFTGCGSSKYNYTVEPTPLKKNESKYKLSKVNLKFSNDGISNSNNFPSESEVKSLFENDIKKYLKENNIYSDKGYLLNIDLNYDRKFINTEGTSLNRPHFSYKVNITDKDGTNVANYRIAKSTTKYGYFGEIKVNLQIGTYQRKADGEKEDIDLITKTLVKEIMDIGK